MPYDVKASNAPNLPAHLAYCACGDCMEQISSAGSALCSTCAKAHCEPEGDECNALKGASEEKQAKRAREVLKRSEAGAVLLPLGFRVTEQYNFEGKSPDGRTVRLIESGGPAGYGPDSMIAAVTECDMETDEEREFSTLADYVSAYEQ